MRVIRSLVSLNFLVLIFLASTVSVSAQLNESSVTLTAGQKSQLQDLASRVLKHSGAAGCKKTCSVLVANFTGESGSTSEIGMALADELSSQLAAQAHDIQIVNRHALRQYLERERIASKLLEDDNAARWLATENGAATVLIGYLKIGLTQANLHVQLLDARDFGKRIRDPQAKSFVEEEVFRDVSNFGSFETAEPFGEPAALKGANEAVDASRSGSGKITAIPHCTHQPDPSYTNAARAVKFRGNIVMRVIIGKDGLIADSQILKGAPFGLNKQALDTVRTWRCQPAEVDGQPAAAMVPIEVSFRIY
jgi:TonB family protein